MDPDPTDQINCGASLAEPDTRSLNAFSFLNNLDVRTATAQDGTVWFCAKDVFEALEITWRSGYSLRNYPQEWVCPLYLRGQSGFGEVLFISEAAVYRAVFRSNKPSAIEFANWVCGEVLPEIRKHGGYGQISVADETRLSQTVASLAKQLDQTRDAFVTRVLLQRLSSLCRMLHQPLPDLSELGADRRQMQLEHV